MKNGGIKITGGTVITRGPNSPNASPLDSATAISISGGVVIVVGKAPSSYGQGGPGGPGGRHEESTLSVANTMQKTQSSQKGLAPGDHTVVIGSTTILYNNFYNYSGSVTVYASSSAVIN